MRVDKDGEYLMNRQEVAEFSLWLNDHPRERFKYFNEVVQSFINYKQNECQNEEWLVEEA